MIPRLFAIAIAIVGIALAATLLSLRLGSFGNPAQVDIAAECAKFAANPTTDDAEVLAFLADQRKEYERLGNLDMVTRIDKHLADWQAGSGVGTDTGTIDSA